MVVAGVLSNELSKQGGVVAEVAVEAATGGAGGARPSALTAAEWDDRGEHDYTSFGCSPSLRTFRCLSSRGMLSSSRSSSKLARRTSSMRRLSGSTCEPKLERVSVSICIGTRSQPATTVSPLTRCIRMRLPL